MSTKVPILNVIDKEYSLYETFVVRDELKNIFYNQYENELISEKELAENLNEIFNFSIPIETIIEKYSDEFRDSENVIFLQPIEDENDTGKVMFEDDEYVKSKF